MIEYAEETVHMEGDTKAIVFWLENRMPEWRNKYVQLKNNDEDENGAGFGMIVMETEQAKEIKKMMEEEQNQRNEEER